MEGVQLLEQAVSEAQKVVEGVKSDQLDAPTPCTDFDLRGLLNHLTGAAKVMASGVATGEIDPSLLGDDLLGDDPASAFRQAAKELLDAWSEPGVLERNVRVPFGEVPGTAAVNFSAVEIYAHTIDAAVATGQEDILDPGVAESTLAVAGQFPLDDFRVPGVLGPEVECSPDAPAHRRLLALLGRQV